MSVPNLAQRIRQDIHTRLQVEWEGDAKHVNALATVASLRLSLEGESIRHPPISAYICIKLVTIWTAHHSQNHGF